jgi:hypothetical protein
MSGLITTLVSRTDRALDHSLQRFFIPSKVVRALFVFEQKFILSLHAKANIH